MWKKIAKIAGATIVGGLPGAVIATTATVISDNKKKKPHICGVFLKTVKGRSRLLRPLIIIELQNFNIYTCFISHIINKWRYAVGG